eukprot:4159603-Pyramimonas_sp.AAC.1
MHRTLSSTSSNSSSSGQGQRAAEGSMPRQSSRSSSAWSKSYHRRPQTRRIRTQQFGSSLLRPAMTQRHWQRFGKIRARS